jgi:hypothetical protein
MHLHVRQYTSRYCALIPEMSGERASNLWPFDPRADCRHDSAPLLPDFHEQITEKERGIIERFRNETENPHHFW